VSIRSHASVTPNTLALTVRKLKYARYAKRTAQNTAINRRVNVCVVNLTRASFVNSNKIHVLKIHARTAVNATVTRPISIAYAKKASKANDAS